MDKSKRARIQDVAELAGVSNMTVSRVLNGGVKVSDEKRRAVLDAVEQLSYQPNSAARRLASHKSYMLALLYQGADSSFVSKFLLRASKSCRARGYHLVPDEIDNNIEESIKAVRALIQVSQIDGVILLPPISDNETVIELLQSSRVPFVRISPDSQLDICPCITIDEYRAGYVVTKKLIELGHKHIAHIQGDPEQGTSHQRRQGYLDALRESGLSTPVNYIEQGTYTYESGVHASRKLLTLKERPTAIFAANDEMAAAVIFVANSLGIRVPEQVSVAGIDDTQLAVILSPHLTTVRQPIIEMADLAVRLLVNGEANFNIRSKTNGRGEKSSLSISGSLSDPSVGSPDNFRHILDFELIQRESTISPL